MDIANYDLFAALLTFPGPSYEADLAEAMGYCERDYVAAARELRSFEQLIPKGDLRTMRELHTRTFDVQPITSLDIGYTLFGEDYKRGALLANLNNEHNRAHNDCGVELADHLTNVLRLLPKLEDLALREELVRVVVSPALREMIREFGPDRLTKKEELYKKHHKTIIESAVGDTRLAYLHALNAVHFVLKQDFGLKITLPKQQESKFVASFDMEMGIEDSGPCAAK